PPEPWAKGDPADSLYRRAREALNKGDYRVAADLFRQVADRYPKSEYAGDAIYWRAYALYRNNSGNDLTQALDLLTSLEKRYPKIAQGGDASTLRTRVCGELARRGDARCAAEISRP